MRNETAAGANRLLRTRRGEAWKMVVDLDPAGAPEAGLRLRTNGSEATIAGVRRDPPEIFLDRRRSGDTGFHDTFAAVHRAPVRPGRVELHIFVDRSSVEVFANAGEAVISDRIFPPAGSDGIEFFGAAKIKSLQLWELKSIWD